MPLTKEEKSVYMKQYIIDNKEKIKEQRKQYRIDHKAEIKEQTKQHYDGNKEEINQRIKQYKIDNPVKCRKQYIIAKWKLRGIIGDLSFIYDCAYITATHCWVCKKTFKDTNDRCLDHCHSSGEFRQILCRSCNVMDSWKKY